MSLAQVTQIIFVSRHMTEQDVTLLVTQWDKEKFVTRKNHKDGQAKQK
jgi:hypothetical protein